MAARAPAARTKKKRTTKAASRSSGRRAMDMTKARKKQKEVEERSQGEYFDLKQGWNWFFLLPPWSDEGVIWKEVLRHGMHVCPHHAVGKTCRMCDEIRRRLKKGDTDFVDENKLKPSAYFNALRKLDVKKADPNLSKVLRCSPGVFNEIMEFITDEDVDPTDVTAAYPLGIKKTGTGLRTRYKVKFGEPLDISRYITEEFLEKALLDLDVIRAVQPASDKDLRKAIRGAADEDDDEDLDDDEELEEGEDTEEEEADEADELDDDEDEESESEEDELLNEPDDEDDEEAEEEEPEDEDEDLGDDEEEEEEPPKPARRKKKVAKKKVTKKKTTTRRRR